ncbi:hypothetical protein [uncultured Pontibacter sp.]|uniref:hypothetical protein n=1 Tax=uncultured Pontibacter sp. TaxID=453356 RepID=UPI0026360936|nr:hypothetical protein [uncultured Pontibacter sp.]
MEFDTKRITELCIKYKITIRDFYFLYCLIIEDIESIVAYIDGSVDEWLDIDDFNSLYRKGLIDFAGVEGKDYTSENVPSDIIIVNPNFERDIMGKGLYMQ